jgi:hypothetical protein
MPNTIAFSSLILHKIILYFPPLQPILNIELHRSLGLYSHKIESLHINMFHTPCKCSRWFNIQNIFSLQSIYKFAPYISGFTTTYAISAYHHQCSMSYLEGNGGVQHSRVPLSLSECPLFLISKSTYAIIN